MLNIYRNFIYENIMQSSFNFILNCIFNVIIKHDDVMLNHECDENKKNLNSKL